MPCWLLTSQEVSKTSFLDFCLVFRGYRLRLAPCWRGIGDSHLPFAYYSIFCDKSLGVDTTLNFGVHRGSDRCLKSWIVCWNVGQNDDWSWGVAELWLCHTGLSLQQPRLHRQSLRFVYVCGEGMGFVMVSCACDFDQVPENCHMLDSAELTTHRDSCSNSR